MQVHIRILASLGLLSVALIPVALWVRDATKEPPWVLPPPHPYSLIRGTIVDEDDHPLKDVIVELFPADKAGEARWYAKEFDFTDETGAYSFQYLQPGRYIVAVHYYDAPDHRRPYAKVFYPGADDEGSAARVIFGMNGVTLQPLRVRRLPLARVAIEVRWADGSRPASSNLLFHNLDYPDHGVIGDTAPEIENGIGEFILPEGFTYDAVASVTCDLGNRHESRESQPSQRVTAQKGVTPATMTFVLGPPCKLWAPK